MDPELDDHIMWHGVLKTQYSICRYLVLRDVYKVPIKIMRSLKTPKNQEDASIATPRSQDDAFTMITNINHDGDVFIMCVLIGCRR